ncbi:MAG: branched-chain amino acid ABC transporter permease [Inquilinus sp.]|nr:branched-chain amino acid ABC transporter permease [Inquilinus sp.]
MASSAASTATTGIGNGRPERGRNSGPDRKRPRVSRIRPVAALSVVLLAAGCGAEDAEQARLCRAVIPALEGGAVIERVETLPAPAPHDVALRYYATDGTGRTIVQDLTCRFAGGTLQAGRLDLVGVDSDRTGELTPVRLHMLRVWLALFDAGRVAAPDQGPANGAPRGAGFTAVYLLQQGVNAIAIGCIYALLAVGFTLVYGIIGRINLAFGELAMIGGFTTFIGATLAGGVPGVPLPLALLAVLGLAMAVAGAHGWATERLVFRPLRGSTSQAALIATIGLAIFLQEYVRLIQGSRDRWLQPVFSERLDLAEAGGFAASISLGQIVVAGLTAVLLTGLHLILTRTGLGRAQRACADDSGMAALLGVDVDRTIGRTFALGGALAAAAGFVVATYFGGVNFFMGHMLGFKALAAAIVGGIGSVGGAILGGLLIGLFETLWSGYLAIAYKDIAVFTVLTVVLIFRPDGLLGRGSSRRV